MPRYYSELLHLKIKSEPFYFQSEFIEAWSSSHPAGHPVPTQPPQVRECVYFLPLSLHGFPPLLSFPQALGCPRGKEENDPKREHMV